MPDDLRLSDVVERQRTKLDPREEQAFQQWYRGWADTAGIDPNPDDPRHQYDYRGAYKSGVSPAIDPSDGLYHWPSQFKDPDHPRRFIDGVDTTQSDSMTLSEINALSRRTPDPSVYMGPVIWESGSTKAGMYPIPSPRSKPQVYPDREAPPGRSLYGKPRR
jgi:hypothetical protein